MSRSRFTAAAAAVFLASAAPAFAGDSHPRVVGGGEDASVAYGPGPARNVVGGGRLAVHRFADDASEVDYLDGGALQPPRAGERPLLAGTGDGTEALWVPAAGPPAGGDGGAALLAASGAARR